MDNIEKLKKFKELLDQGIISQEEFDRKKAELLDIKANTDTTPNNKLNEFNLKDKLSKTKEKINLKQFIKKHKKPLIISFSSLVLLIIIGVVIVVNVFTVPDFTGMTMSEIASLIKTKAFNVVFHQDDYKKKYKKDVAYKQSVKPNTLNFKCQTVDIYVSKGFKYTIPYLKGKNYDDVKKYLKHFKVSKVYYYYTDYGSWIGKEGNIYKYKVNGEETISEDSFIANSKVKLYISKGLRDYSIEGESLSFGKKIFKGCKFKVKYVDSAKKKNTIISFKQSKTTKMSDKTTITFKVSKGNMLKIPDVKGMGYNRAIKWLNKVGVKYRVAYAYSGNYGDADCYKLGAGKIKSQSRKGIAKKGTTITITVLKPAFTINSITSKIDTVGGVDLDISFTNHSSKTISKVVMTIKYYDRVGDPSYDDITDSVTSRLKATGPFSPGSTHKLTWETTHYDRTAAAFMPTKAVVKFTDGTTQTLDFDGRYWYSSAYYGGDLND